MKAEAIFFGHGSPMNAITDNEFAKEWKRIGKSLTKPKAILCISAHYETNGTYITANEHPPTIHDFGGFPKELFAVQYPAPGDPKLVNTILERIPEIYADLEWGLDHGTWSVLRHVFPYADIPILQLSLDRNKSPKEHFEFAKSLGYLRDEGVLIVGSGNLVHNLRLVAWDKMNEPEFFYDWAEDANKTLKEWILSENIKFLSEPFSHGDSLKKAIPTLEHFLPALYILGVKTPADSIQFFNDKPVMGSLSMTSFRVN
ncbi:MAG: 4,5-DOPA dioxygenase extradiol [Leptospira sp.]|nr:4,5-DOPA dioxygenase extradiol [Leptospira sp.]